MYVYICIYIYTYIYIYVIPFRALVSLGPVGVTLSRASFLRLDRNTDTVGSSIGPEGGFGLSPGKLVPLK